MALVIEDGSIVAGANSYITLDEFRAFAEDRGVEPPTSEDELAPMIFEAADYINAYEPRYKGERVNPLGQEMSWPRKRVKIFGADFPDDKIPPQLKVAQLQAALTVLQGTSLLPNITSFAVRREKVDVIEVEYATGGGQNNTATEEMTPKFPAIMSSLDPLFRPSEILRAYRS
ncbi:MAG: hypothetical protein M0P09_01285 [Acholeplasmataceae bacterium]|nr:hypothetical protein [Acholeplasmataceae bacterium]